MPISCECPSCGKRLKAPDAAAGKRALCPKCGSPVQIPAVPVYDAEEASEPAAAVFDDQTRRENVNADRGSAGPSGADRRPCPACGEMIAAAAVKCRYCGEFLDAALKNQLPHQRRGVSEADEKMEPVDWVLALVCSAIGCIVSIVYLIQGKPKAGKML